LGTRKETLGSRKDSLGTRKDTIISLNIAVIHEGLHPRPETMKILPPMLPFNY
jgi:hypothetical protein